MDGRGDGGAAAGRTRPAGEAGLEAPVADDVDVGGLRGAGGEGGQTAGGQGGGAQQGEGAYAVHVGSGGGEGDVKNAPGGMWGAPQPSWSSPIPVSRVCAMWLVTTVRPIPVVRISRHL
ncbi:hypothetical protein GCM10020254_34200 [Streptomyces goshikiensis]